MIEMMKNDIADRDKEIVALKAANNISNPLAGLGLGGGGIKPAARGPPAARGAASGPPARAAGRGPPSPPGGGGRGPPAPPGGGRGAGGPPAAPGARGAPGRGAPAGRGGAGRGRGKAPEVQPTKKVIKLTKKVKPFVWKRVLNG